VKSGSGDGGAGGEEKEKKEGAGEVWGEVGVGKLVEVFFLGMENAKYSVVRNAAVEAFGDLVLATKGTPSSPLLLYISSPPPPHPTPLSSPILFSSHIFSRNRFIGTTHG
jgi:hypothetical protein